MTERKWLTSADPHALVEYAEDDRRRRLLIGCAVARRVVHVADYPAFSEILNILERRADGIASPEEITGASQLATLAHDRSFAPSGEPSHPQLRSKHGRRVVWGVYSLCDEDIFDALTELVGFGPRGSGLTARQAADIVRDVFGNPFRPFVIGPTVLAWDDGRVPRFAAAMYASGDFADMPVLGDMLEDAGCADAHIIAHARSPLHVRGCALIDALRQRNDTAPTPPGAGAA